MTQENEARKREHEERLKQLSVSYGLYMDKLLCTMWHGWMNMGGSTTYVHVYIHITLVLFVQSAHND